MKYMYYFIYYFPSKLKPYGYYMNIYLQKIVKKMANYYKNYIWLHQLSIKLWSVWSSKKVVLLSGKLEKNASYSWCLIINMIRHYNRNIWGAAMAYY